MIPDFILNALVVFLLIWVVFLLKKKEKHRHSENNPLIDRPENKILIENILNNDTEGVKRSFKSYRAAPHSKSQFGESALELAIQKDNKYIVAYLIKYGAIPNAIEREEALKSGNTEIIEMLETGNHLRLIREYEFFRKTK
jgi:ankyrin repeat protein